MDTTFALLRTAALDAREALGRAAGTHGAPPEGRMAAVAAGALFQEAMLAALHARLGELKAAAR